MYLNRATVVGNLTRDPELKSLPSGGQVASFSVATNHTYKDRDGNRAEQTDYHNVVVFGGQAENCARFLRKGSQALVDGRLQTRSWEQDGVKHYRTEIVAERVQFGTRAKTEEATPARQQDTPSEAVASQPKYEYPVEDINPEDIPF